jgi:hypothetical protein
VKSSGFTCARTKVALAIERTAVAILSGKRVLFMGSY